MLAHGAKCQVPDHWGNTALHEAAWNGEIECCLALLAAGADLTKPGNERKTAADLADDDNYFECSSLLRNLEGCWNTALVAQLMLDVRQMSKRESRIATHMQDHAERFQELEKNILRVVKDEERKHVVTVEAEVKEIQNSTNNLIRGIEKKIIRNEDKQTSMLSRISALDTEIQAVENSVSRGDQLPISREDLDDLELVGRKKKPKRKSGPVPPPSSSHDDEGSNLVEVAESRALETSPKFLSSHDLSPCQMNYPFPTPGSSVSADTPSPGPADHDLDTSVMLKSRSTTKEVIKSPGKDNVAAQEFKEFHLEFLRSTANEKFSDKGMISVSRAIGDCVQTVAKLKDSLRLVTDQTRPSTSQVQAALGQWQSALEGLMDQQNAYLESIARWAEDDAPIRDAPRLPNIAPMPNAPEVDLRIIAEQLASLHLAAKHKATSFD
ncbi:unnamed protein product [Notodromas monacha]|uniref:Uncharacterized protein n=1 Tax=Notodromas monacha TaxID=399045 RepID=A0A7R9GKU6_9CRUS|nr:unnamed protein product [Notodromas monacha]CAG0924269.1 unnamed protein product [Notodromas monacha]